MQQEVGLPAQPVEPRNWVPRLDIGEAGVRQGVAVKFRAGLLGCVARGSLGYLKPGRYRLALGIRSRPNSSAGYDARILIELITSSRLISVHVLTRADLRNAQHKFVFDVPEQAKNEMEFFFIKKIDEILPLVLTELPEKYGKPKQSNHD